MLAQETLSLSYRDAGQERCYRLTGRARTTLGRAPTCDLVLHDERVSRTHATIQLVDDHCLLADQGSANGTFLNGVRLHPGTSFSLREGDVIELGDQRIVFGRAEASHAEVELRTTTFGAEELVRDGYAGLDLAERRELQIAIQRAFEDVPRTVGIERSLEVARDLVAGHSVAFFTPDAAGSLRPFAARPQNGSTASLAALARQVWSRRDARLVLGLRGRDSNASGDTCVHEHESRAALPVAIRQSVVGVLAVERFSRKRLDRADLALLAVIADRLAVALSVHGKSVDDTRPGYAA